MTSESRTPAVCALSERLAEAEKLRRFLEGRRAFFWITAFVAVTNSVATSAAAINHRCLDAIRPFDGFAGEFGRCPGRNITISSVSSMGMGVSLLKFHGLLFRAFSWKIIFGEGFLTASSEKCFVKILKFNFSERRRKDC